MRKMKDSGIEWIGDIPKDWSITKIKFLLSNENDSLKVGPFGSQLSGSDFVAEGYWVYSQRVVLDKNFEHNSMLVTKEKFDTMSAFRVREKDILITTRGTIGKICRVPKKFSEGILHPCIIKFRIDEQKYCYKLLELIFNHSGILQKQLNYLSNATTIEVIYSGILKNLQIPFPPLDEQKKIADFLDEKCSEIDSIRSDIQKQIDILNDYKKSVITEAVTGRLEERTGFRSTDERREKKWKDSRIPRIGKIPVEWGTSRIKYVCSVIGSGTTPSSGNVLYYEGSENWIQSGDLYKKKYITETEKTVTDYAVSTISALHKYKADFIVIAMYGASIGNVAISKIDACVNQACCVIKPNSKVNFNYLYYTLINDKDIMLDMSIGGTQPNISQAKILELPVLLPPLSEQKAIADYLDEKCSAIDATIADKQRQLETLDEYKKSLIFEYVTGKKEVPT